MEKMLSGRCECGAVRFEVEGPIEDMCHCHCSQCRRLHGAAFATFAGVERSLFHYVCGEETVRDYASSDKNLRVFCGVCGSNLYVDAIDEPEVRYLAMSTLEGDPDHPVAYHQFVGSRAPWHTIEDDLDQFEQGAPI